MKSGSDALIFLYAFFWAAALAMTGRYQAFDTPSMWDGQGRAWRRFLAGFLVLNVLPIGWLTLLYMRVVPPREGLGPIVAAAVASLSVFAFHRLLHGLIASDLTCAWFYTHEEIQAVRDRGPFKQPQSFAAHFWPGVIYLFGYGLLAWTVGRMFS
jgi:hypothetical protein